MGDGWYGEWKYEDEILEISVFHCGTPAKLVPPDPEDEKGEGLFICRKCGAVIPSDFFSSRGKAAFVGCELDSTSNIKNKKGEK